ncbi:MAG TPA: phytanoyl-CoA dioxygenase family protein [Tepidisphaeraceae bacterium]|nr:phytanoyl-CoA dioxygenase family protein [Tepidisphaeraceae bacterium]
MPATLDPVSMSPAPAPRAAVIPPLTCAKHPVDPGHVGLLADCTPLLNDRAALLAHVERHGYLYFPGFHPRDEVVAGRRLFIDKLRDADALDPAHDLMAGVLRTPAKAPGFAGGRLDALFPDDWPILDQILYGPRMMNFFAALFGEPALHYDYTWTRQVNPGPATPIHSDVVYMGRGTHELFTVWTPFGDNSFDVGGLILLEGSNRHPGLAKAYWQSDVDAYCENKPDGRAWAKSWGTGGMLKGGPAQVRRSLKLDRWLTADYRMGDVVIFPVYTVHGGTDNHTSRVRLSTDTRYQRATAATDDRWVGPNPPAHGPAAKRGLIC